MCVSNSILSMEGFCECVPIVASICASASAPQQVSRISVFTMLKDPVWSEFAATMNLVRDLFLPVLSGCKVPITHAFFDEQIAQSNAQCALHIHDSTGMRYEALTVDEAPNVFRWPRPQVHNTSKSLQHLDTCTEIRS